MTLVLGRPRAVEALGMAGLASWSLSVPVLRGSALLVRHTVPVVVDQKTFLTGHTGPGG